MWCSARNPSTISTRSSPYTLGDSKTGTNRPSSREHQRLPLPGHLARGQAGPGARWARLLRRDRVHARRDQSRPPVTPGAAPGRPPRHHRPPARPAREHRDRSRRPRAVVTQPCGHVHAGRSDDPFHETRWRQDQPLQELQRNEQRGRPANRLAGDAPAAGRISRRTRREDRAHACDHNLESQMADVLVRDGGDLVRAAWHRLRAAIVATATFGRARSCGIRVRVLLECLSRDLAVQRP